MRRLVGVLGSVVLGLAVPAVASATSIPLRFDCPFLTIASALTCAPGDPHGSLTLSDGVADSDGIVSLPLTRRNGARAQNGAAPSDMFLNWTGSPSLTRANTSSLVAPNAPVGSEVSVGSPQSTSNEETRDSHSAFDLRVIPPDNDFDFNGSIAVFLTSPTPGVELSTDIASFYPVLDSGDETIPLYAALTVNNDPNLPADESGVAAADIIPVPEPASLSLIAVGLASLAVLRRRPGAQPA